MCSVPAVRRPLGARRSGLAEARSARTTRGRSMTRFLLFFSASAILAACTGDNVVSPLPEGRLVVHVHWQEQGSAGKLVEVLGTGQARETDAGGLAQFDLAAGRYRVRTHDVNGPGPTPGYVDSVAFVKAGGTTRLEITDCVPCSRVEVFDAETAR